MGAQSFGRFASVAFPAFLVAGMILARLPGPVAAVLLAASALFFGIFSALFAAGYPVC
jgi:hypothetical protein